MYFINKRLDNSLIRAVSEQITCNCCDLCYNAIMRLDNTISNLKTWVSTEQTSPLCCLASNSVLALYLSCEN